MVRFSLMRKLFAILQKYDFSSKSQRVTRGIAVYTCCLRYCKSTIFQANHNPSIILKSSLTVVCDTAKVRFFKQITTFSATLAYISCCLRYCKSTIFQANHNKKCQHYNNIMLFAILQKYDFSSKSQQMRLRMAYAQSCLRYCKSTIFQANHNEKALNQAYHALFAILQKYDFSSKSQQKYTGHLDCRGCLRYCKSTIFQANHNGIC